MTHNNKLNERDISLIAMAVAAAGVIAAAVIVCTKAVSTMLKLNKALDIYIEDHKYHNDCEKMMGNLYKECADDEDMSF